MGWQTALSEDGEGWSSTRIEVNAAFPYVIRLSGVRLCIFLHAFVNVLLYTRVGVSSFCNRQSHRQLHPLTPHVPHLMNLINWISPLLHSRSFSTNNASSTRTFRYSLTSSIASHRGGRGALRMLDVFPFSSLFTSQASTVSMSSRNM